MLKLLALELQGKAKLGRVNTGDSTNTMAFVIFPAATLAAICTALGRRKFYK